MSFGLILRNLHDYSLVFVGLCNAVLAYPNNHASYPVPVRQFRLLPYRLLRCMGRPKPPCGLLMLPGVTPVHEGLTPSGLFFYSKNFGIFTIQGTHSTYPKVAVQWLNQALCFYQSLCLVDSEVLRTRHLRVAAKR